MAKTKCSKGLIDRRLNRSKEVALSTYLPFQPWMSNRVCSHPLGLNRAGIKDIKGDMLQPLSLKKGALAGTVQVHKLRVRKGNSPK